ncbi:MAG TPA: sugar phosphate isomerase/epimerase [Candidatus Saccharimonadales bacterium]|nr:sugar phosphate isomerase/epimerase [Candidatus Saccharimonadales bacterium]
MSWGTADNLTLSVMTLRNAGLVERVRAAGIAGYQGIGWRLEDITNALQSGMTESDIVRLFSATKVKPIEIEFFRQWVGLENDREYQDREFQLLEWAGKLRARHINVAVFEDDSHDKIVASLSGLCRRAYDKNLLVQLEFMPYNPSVNTLAKAWEIVRDTNQLNAGLLIDAWHWNRANCTSESLHGIPPEKITSIQISDDLAQPMTDVSEESRHDRLVPGRGAIDLTEFLTTLEEYGVSAPLSVEVMSDELDALEPAQAALETAVGARYVLWQYAGRTFIPNTNEQS